MAINTYYIDLEKALLMLERDYNKVQIEADKHDEYADTNYPEVLSNLSEIKRKLLRMLSVHKYLRLTKENYLNNIQDNADKIIVNYAVADYDTPSGIANKFKVSLEELLLSNNLTTDQIKIGIVLKIEQTGNTNGTNSIYKNIPSYGSQIGDLVYGMDIQNEISVDNIGDLRILSPEETLKQGILNRITTVNGEYPGENDFGIDNLAGSDLPQELRENLIITKTMSQLSLDERIDDVTDLEVTFSQNAVKVAGTITTINNTDLTV